MIFEQLDHLLRELGLEIAAPRRVLVVDDEPENLYVLEAVLEERCEVEIAESGPAALQILRNQDPYDVIISDQRMPEMTGVELLSIVAHEFPSMVRMVLTGYSDLQPIIRSVNEGAVYRFMLKPWDPEEMRATVTDALQLRYAQNALPQVVETVIERRDELAHALNDLKAKQDQLIASERLFTLGRLTSGMTHDIRNNLTVMTHIVDALQGAESPEIQAVASEALASLEAVLALVQDINAFARRENRSEAERSAVLVSEFVQDTLRFFELESPNAKVEIQLHGLEQAKLDPLRARQAVLALLRNAYRAAPDHAVMLQAFSKNGDICFEVADAGPGMDENTLQQARTPFFSGFDPPGMGLGLEIAKLVAEAHGGRLALASQPGHGTTAQLWFGGAVGEVTT